MPPSPPPSKEENEAGQASSNNSSNSAPQSPQETDDANENAMLGVMRMVGDTTRLMSRGTDATAGTNATDGTDDRQTLRDPSPSTTPKSCTTSTSPTRHVADTSSERKNDISSPNSTAEQPSASARILMREQAAPSTRRPPTDQLQPPTPQTTPDSASESAAASASTSVIVSKAHSPHELADLVQATINAAVAASSVAKSKHTETDSSITVPTEETAKMSIDKLVPTKKPRRKRTSQMKSGQTQGRWTDDEHQAFLEGLTNCGREWKKVATRIPTRTSAQIRSHAQKYFSKLQRDHESMAPPDHLGGAAAIPPEGGSQELLGPSVQRNVDRLLSNPRAAQREVEDTLGALRERYRQLQQRLERRQHRRTNNTSASRAPVVEQEEQHSQSSSHSNPRKRALEESLDDQRRRPSYNDDHSSISSNVSASVASLSSSVAAGRDLGDEELIALAVLGGSLPRGDSSTDTNTCSAIREEFKEAQEAKSSDTSIASSNDDNMDVDHEHHEESKREQQEKG